jgi:CheY-like chemotaxis protein
MPDAFSSPTVIAVFISTALAAFFTWWATRATESRKASAQAASQEVTVRAEFVRDLSARARELEERLDAAGRRERELSDRYHSDLDAIDRRYRHLVTNLIMRERQLRRMLYERGAEHIPVFQGWQQFIDEGGEVREAWVADSGEGDDGEDNDRRDYDRRRVIVVDDNSAHARTVQGMLRHEGWEVHCTGSGKHALGELLTGRFQLAIVDIVLPDIDGLELARRAREGGYKGPMIAISGAVDLLGADRIKEAGFAQALQKPARAHQVLEAVRQATRGSSPP